MIDLAALSEWFERRIEKSKRERRIRKALALPSADARIIHAEAALTKDLRFEIQLSYRFEIAGEAAYGSAFSAPVDRENYAKTLAAQISPDAQLTVRFNPHDPFENYALGSDNATGAGGLPFPLSD